LGFAQQGNLSGSPGKPFKNEGFSKTFCFRLSPAFDALMHRYKKFKACERCVESIHGFATNSATPHFRTDRSTEMEVLSE